MIRWEKAKTSDGTWGVGEFEFGPTSQGIQGIPLTASPQFIYKSEDTAQAVADILNYINGPKAK